MTNIIKLDGTEKIFASDVIEALAGSLRGSVFSQGAVEFDASRTLWNAMVDRQPGLVIRAMGTSDIRAAVNFARKNNLLLAIRSGGHQIAGHAVAEGALLLDLSHMQSVHVDPFAKTARVEPGALLSDVDKETQSHALALPTGINSTTGIAGLTLGGGFGWITRKFGMTIDSLLSVDIVTADGSFLTASADKNADLFWAVRGGGGNFGVVTSFEFRLHEVGPSVLAGLIVHPLEDAPSLLRAYNKIAGSAPDELTVWVVMRKAPPLPFLPEDWHGKLVLVFAACYIGDEADGGESLKQLRGLGNPIADVICEAPFVGWQTAFDPLLAPGMRNYWKSHDFNELSSDAVSVLLKAIATLPDPNSEVFIAHVGGAMARVAEDATAYPQRSAHFIMNVHTRWADESGDATCIGWARKLFDDTAQYSTGSVYVNFMPDDEVGRVSGAYGSNMERLGHVKAKYDPKNLFRLNHNIKPTSVSRAAE
ncbi:FAD-binding oxidoreductase [Falsihalocynthiibacter arcticus]|uniref:FAD-linked oxidase n=1 Tax=Falsihalocynthiibacter arcticus TaxID=1579316 RepID=A0A126V3I7_9RHOB|nr:FAD-binding oxidoreductase [Falsihalocynthiibacter arcticus]AML52884.1 FAD-linked oxidase [Falsihalocynthiibacter arcticus]